jgi:hypothetical protein
MLHHCSKNQLIMLLAGTAIASGAFASPQRPGDTQGVQLPPGIRPITERSAARTDAESVARMWNEELLNAIRRDTPRPPVHSRNLYHTSAAMYDSWAAYDAGANAVFRSEQASADDLDAARNEAISYAAYRVLSARFADSPGAVDSQAAFDHLMGLLGYDIANDSTTGDSPAAIGNRIGASVLAQTASDGSNEANGFVDTSGYMPANEPMVVENPGAGPLNSINLWQPLIVPGASEQQEFLTPHWGAVVPFAMQRPSSGQMYLDPGPPPMLGGDGDGVVRQDVMQLLLWSSHLDPDDGVEINISPAVVGNNSLGAQDGTGHPVNPATGEPYPPEITVLRGDWGRVLAEFWADGPRSSTPPGHWNEIANAASDHPDLEKRIGGAGPIVSDLEWDVKLYLTLNGSIHDTAIATWEVKTYYDYVRPITLIRAMGELGQSSDPDGPSYHLDGLPLAEGLVEVITAASSAAGERHAHLADYVGEVTVFAWKGHPADPATEYAGCDWIRAVEWLPYQQFDFVTPPFAGYTSGHSGFSRAAAEVLTLLTGDAYFPGGYGEFLASTGADGFDLGFEFGPNQDVPLTWATYYDAADEAGLSRIYGGIHPAIDDFPGRVLGAEAGIGSYAEGQRYFNGEVGPKGCPGDVDFDGVSGLKDLNLVLANFGQATNDGDTNRDGVVDLADLNNVLAGFGSDCP